MKANVFNDFFANQCSVNPTNSVLPNVNVRTTSSIDDISFSSDSISKIIRNLNSNKAHGFDNISVKMIKLCGEALCEPLAIIFNDCLKTGIFPADWKKGNIIPIYKKGDKNKVSNYRPISLLPVFGKIFEKILYDNLYKYLNENNLFLSNQSGFRNGDSCVNQLLAITHEIYQGFYCSPSVETRSVFLDMSKAFDKVWYEGILLKLKNYGVKGRLLNILNNYLHNRKQRVVLNGIESNWKEIKAGVPKDLYWGHYCFSAVDSVCNMKYDKTTHTMKGSI